MKRILLAAAGLWMFYTAGTGLMGLYQTFTAENFYPLQIRPFVIPYYLQGIAMLMMLASAILCFVAVFSKKEKRFLVFTAILGLTAALIPQFMRLLMFGNFYFHPIMLAPLIVLVLGIRNA